MFVNRILFMYDIETYSLKMHTLKSILIIYFLLPYFSFSKKLLEDSNQECKRCKTLTESFDHWLEKTSRGKFEGGDAAWEEAKLKSYSRSEIRLVEIQEGLCSELKKQQDQCYGLAGEVEQLVEKWWFDNSASNADLFTWLCIDTLQHCCPKFHFGETCMPCPTDKNNKLCSEHGRCDGEGTRKGNGSCICDKGFAGINCESCAFNFYIEKESCEPCHKSCKGCSKFGPENCLSCNPGWHRNQDVCVDRNECMDPSVCKPNQYCLNKEGSYLCKTCHSSCKTCVGPGNNNCSACDTNYKMWSGICIDDKQREEMVFYSIKKLTLYLGLLMILVFIIRTHKLLASFVALVLALYIYISEKTASVNIADVIYYHVYS